MRLANEKTKMQPQLRDLFIGLVWICCCLPTSTWAQGTLSDKRLCADPKCEQIISTGIAKISYATGGEGLISFKINTPIRVLSKSAGSNKQLWGVDINGRRGYANKDFIMEKKILVRDAELKFEVPVVGPGSPPSPPAVAEPLQTVLNASESSDDMATTTTAPLDVQVEAIVVENDKTKDQQAPDPTKATQAQLLQLVDGTELPLEAIPAVTDGTPNPKPSDAAKSEPASTASVDLKQTQEATVDSQKPQDATVDSQKPQAVTVDSQKPQDATVDSLKPQDATVDSQKLENATVELSKPQDATIDLQKRQEAAVDAKKPQEAAVDAKEPQEAAVDAKKPQEEPTDPILPTAGEQDSAKLLDAINAELEDSDDFDYGDDEIDEDDELNQDSEDKESIDSDKLNDTKTLNVIETIGIEQENTTLNLVKPKEEANVEQAEITNATTELPKDLATESASVDKEVVKEVPETTTVESQPLEALKIEEITEKLEVPETPPARPAVSESVDDGVVKVDIASSATEVKTETEKDSRENADEPVVVQSEASSTGSGPIEKELVKSEPVVLPPLFENANPDYYKHLQEQQQQQTLKEQVEQQTLKEEQQQEEVKQSLRLPEQQLPLSDPVEPESNEVYADPNDYYNKQQSTEYPHHQHQHPDYHHHHHPTERAEQTTISAVPDSPYGSVHEEDVTPAPQAAAGVGSVEPVALPATASPLAEAPTKDDGALGLGLFATIVDTVNNFIGKEPESAGFDGSDELQRILYPGVGEVAGSPRKPAADSAPTVDMDGYCARFQSQKDDYCHRSISLDNFAEILTAKVVDHSLLLLCVVIAAASSLFFIFAYYCFCNSSQEGALLSKLNHLERSLLASHKENHIIKHELMTTRHKLASIEDNSFGSNDMVAELKKQLEKEVFEKAKLQEQVGSLERDLDNAAEAGLELNKMLSEVLSNQNGDEAFLSTVDELQRQLNDQERIMIEINSSLAEKSRENSELQYTFAETTSRLNGELKTLQEDNYELEMEKSRLQTRLDEIQAETDGEMAKVLEARNYEMQRLQNQILDLTAKWEREHGDYQTSLAKIEALEDCLKAVKKDANLNVQELIASAKTRGELNAAQRKFVELQAKLEQEVAHKQRIEGQLQQSSSDVEQLKQDFNQSERDKLEAQTRLEVLSGYFREKENELKKELSLQETKWLQHQGENASTVETQTLMKNEIQTLKSQNDELRAEIEAQIASHKAQMGTLENRAHESWLAARQSERRCEEALAEAAGLRRKLTTMASGGGDPVAVEAIAANGAGPALGAELKAAPSPLPLPLPGLPGSPLLNMPNPLPFLAAPFSPFMGLPPPPFLPPAGGGARPPPLGRMRSPPPSARGDRDRDRDRDRYSDYSDYDDYDDDDEDERDALDHRRRHSGSWGRHHHSFTHSPRTYRSLSPSDSRYNYNDTETDFSPPPSPPPVSSNRSAASRPYSEV
ncbi:transport and Golgi organization protein 1 [Drosophila kikkawai]|uniref:Transport and Golgi organization protein 1 n=1 Tax=Drosophila kikkawai TaxID=30033 RepID=A0A6P4ITN9_DROKI|nr:transport and Golgi organization protein 1 [Drosophila kikkawai]